MSAAIDKKAKKRVSSLIANYKKWSEVRHPYLDFIINESDVGKWWVRIRDLQDEFAGGEYIVEMVAPKEYPFGPPEFYFKTPTGVYGCNVKVCISIGEFHKDDFAAGQGGMGGFAVQLINGIIFWQELGHGISILHGEYYSANKVQKQEMLPGLQIEKRLLAKESKEFNRKHFGSLIDQFDNLPLNVIYRSIPELKHSNKVTALIKNYITAV